MGSFTIARHLVDIDGALPSNSYQIDTDLWRIGPFPPGKYGTEIRQFVESGSIQSIVLQFEPRITQPGSYLEAKGDPGNDGIDGQDGEQGPPGPAPTWQNL